MGFLSEFRALRHNPRTSLKLIPLWSIPFFMYNSYAVLYASHMGVTAMQLGVISSVSFGIRFVAAFFAGTVINRFSRKRVMVLFDILSWVLPCAIWAVSRNFWYFLAAGSLNSLGALSGIASSCIYIEDTDPRQKLFFFRMNETINAISGMFSLLAGLLVLLYGIVPAVRGLYVAGFFGSAAMAALKGVFITNNRYGMIERQERILKGAVKDFMESFRYFGKKPSLYKLLAQSLLFSFAQALTDVYYLLYLTRNLGISESVVSIIPFANAVVALIFLNFLLPILAGGKGNSVGIIIHLAGTAVLLAASLFTGSFALVLVNSLLWAAGKAYLNPVINSKIANEIEESRRATIMSSVNAVSMIFLLPAGLIGAMLYNAGAVLPFCLVFLIYLAALALQLARSRRREPPPHLFPS